MKFFTTVKAVEGTYAKFKTWRNVTLGNIVGSDYFQTRLIAPDGTEFPLFFCHGAEDGRISVNGNLVKREAMYEKLAPSVKRKGWSKCYILCCFNGIEPAMEIDGVKFIPLFPTTAPVFCYEGFVDDGEEALCWEWSYDPSVDSDEFNHLNDEKFFRTQRID